MSIAVAEDEGLVGARLRDARSGSLEHVYAGEELRPSEGVSRSENAAASCSPGSAVEGFREELPLRGRVCAAPARHWRGQLARRQGSTIPAAPSAHWSAGVPANGSAGGPAVDGFRLLTMPPPRCCPWGRSGAREQAGHREDHDRDGPRQGLRGAPPAPGTPGHPAIPSPGPARPLLRLLAGLLRGLRALGGGWLMVRGGARPAFDQLAELAVSVVFGGRMAADPLRHAYEYTDSEDLAKGLRIKNRTTGCPSPARTCCARVASATRTG